MSELKTLKTRYALELVPKAPFNFDATLYKPDHFPSADHEWQPGIRWQTMRWKNELLGLKFESLGSIDVPRVCLTVWSDKELKPLFLEELVREIEYRYNIQLDLTEFNQSFTGESQLEPILQKWRGMRPLNYSSLYEYLIIAIVLQNATVRRSVSMLQALFEKYGTLLSYDSKHLYCYWAPEAIHQATEQDLRDLKVGYRAKSIKRVTAAFVEEEIDELVLRSKTRDEQRKTLLALYGIGPASVGYILSDVFHHLDEMNYISPWEQKIYSRLFFDTPIEEPVTMRQLINVFQNRFGKYQQLAVHYIWEDLFWKRKFENIEWLETLIRL